METNSRSQQSKQIPPDREIQNGDTGNNKDLPPDMVMGDFKDAYFHIAIQSQSRKYIRFHVQGQTYQFKALPFGLSTASIEFTIVAKEVTLVALQVDIRIH